MSKFKQQRIINLLLSYLGIFIAFFNTIFKAKILSTEEIGVLTILVTISTLSVFFVNMGLPAIISKFFYRIESNDNKQSALIILVFVFTLINSIIFSFGLILFKKIIIARYDNILLYQYYYLIFIAIFSESINKIWISIFRVEYKSVICNFIYDFLYKFLTLTLLILFLFSIIDFSKYIILFFFLYLIRTIFFIFFYMRGRKIVKPDFSILKKRNIKIAINYAFFMFFGGMAGIITITIDKLMLGALLNISSAGIYGIIITFPILIQAIGSAFSMTANAQISNYWQHDKKEKINQLYKENVSIQMFLGFFLFGVLSIFSNQLLLFIGDEYTVANKALILLMFGELVNVSTGMNGAIIAFSKYYKFDFYIRILLIGITIITNIIFIPIWGLTGAAFATSISLILYNLLKVLFVRIKFNFFPYSIETLKFVLISLLFFALLYLFNKIIKIESIIVVITISFVCFIVYLLIHKFLLKLSFLQNLNHFVKR